MGTVPQSTSQSINVGAEAVLFFYELDTTSYLRELTNANAATVIQRVLG